VTTLSEAFGFEFFRHAVVAATLVGGLCGLMGVPIVLRRMSYAGHGLSHAMFGGAVISVVLGWNFTLGAVIWGFIAALLIEKTAHRRGIGADAAIGIVTSASFALGLAVISMRRGFRQNVEGVLFGNILGVTNGDHLAIGGVTAAIGIALFIGYKPLLFTTFDPDLARIYGIRGDWVDTIFALALAAMIAVSMHIVGVTLIAAAIVIPPSTARLLTHSFSRLLPLSAGLGAFYGFGGMLLSYATDIASGAAIVLLAASIFAAVYAITGARRMLATHSHPALSSRRPHTHLAPSDILPSD